MTTPPTGPFVSINCAALYDDLAGSGIVFGYRKGAFTGAGTRRKGKTPLGTTRERFFSTKSAR